MARPGPNARWHSASALSAMLLAASVAAILHAPIGLASHHSDLAPKRFAWENVDGSSYLAVGVRTNRDGPMEVQFEYDATWEDARSYFALGGMLDETDGSHVRRGGFYSNSETTCPKGALTIEECPRKHVRRQDAPKMAGEWYKGEHVLFLATFGAGEARLTIRANLSGEAEIAWVASGNTSLLEMAERNSTHYSGQVRATLLHSFLGFFRGSGDYSAEPRWHASEKNGTRYEFLSCTSFYCKDRDGNDSQPIVPGSPGTWTFGAEDGGRDVNGERPMVGLVGVAIDPPLFADDGTLRPMTAATCHSEQVVQPGRRPPGDEAHVGGEWPTFRGSMERAGGEATDLASPGPWKRSLAYPITSSPAVADDRVYVAAGAPLPPNLGNEGAVYALELATGAVLWKRGLDSAVESSPAAARGLLVLGTSEAGVWSLAAADGSTIWRFAVSAVVSASPAIDGGLAFVGTTDRHLEAIQLGTGEVAWEWKFCDFVESPTVEGGTLYVATSDGFVHAMQASNGTMVWRTKVGRPVLSAPAVGGGLVVVTSGDSSVHALETSDGVPRWSFGTGARIQSAAAIAGGTVLVTSTDGFAYSLDLQNGTMRWAFATGSPIHATPAVRGNRVAVAASEGTVFLLDARNGATLDRLVVRGSVFASPILTEDHLLVATQEGDLHAICLTCKREDPGLPGFLAAAMASASAVAASIRARFRRR